MSLKAFILARTFSSAISYDSCSQAFHETVTVLKLMLPHFDTNTDINGSSIQVHLQVCRAEFRMSLCLFPAVKKHICFSLPLKALLVTVLIWGLEVGAGSLRQAVYEMKMFSFPMMASVTFHILKSSAYSSLGKCSHFFGRFPLSQ